MDENTGKVDPIRERYFGPLEIAERTSDVLFYVAAVLSIAAVSTSKESHPGLYETVQILFLLATIAGVVIGLAIRLYWSPRAQGKRAEDFFSEGFDTPLTYERTKKYYNNEETEPVRKIGFQLLENTLFSKAIALRMCRNERIKIGGYAVLWLIAIAARFTSIDIIVVISQALFSEQLLSRIARIEWLRMRFESLHASTYALLQSGSKGTPFEAAIFANVVAYESAKANAAITMSAKMFKELNESLSKEWEEIKHKLGRD